MGDTNKLIKKLETLEVHLNPARGAVEGPFEATRLTDTQVFESAPSDGSATRETTASGTRETSSGRRRRRVASSTHTSPRSGRSTTPHPHAVEDPGNQSVITTTFDLWKTIWSKPVEARIMRVAKS